MNYQTILYEIKDGAGRLTLNRPEKLNSFNELMHEEVRQVLIKLKSEPVRALLITGAGRGFCAGQDLGDRRIGPIRASISVRRLKNTMRHWCVHCERCLFPSLPESMALRLERAQTSPWRVI
jgi:enoyl-CoA hydratase/carnithine racemase